MNGKINVGSNKKVTIDGEKVKEKINLETFKGDNPLMLGSAGYTFPAKTLLKDELEIINSVGGEDLTDTVAEQTVAVEDLLRMVNRKVADHKGEGQYVWKKLTAEDGDFIDYVVSSDTGAFPDGDTQDGYWYELVEEKTEWEFFTASYNFPDGGTYSTNTGNVSTPTLFSIGTHEIHITEVTCGTVGGSSDMGRFYPMEKYEYENSLETSVPLETPLFLSLACGVMESSIGDCFADTAYNRKSRNHLAWTVNGSNVSLTRVGSCSNYSKTAWGIPSVAIKGYRRKI